MARIVEAMCGGTVVRIYTGRPKGLLPRYGVNFTRRGQLFNASFDYYGELQMITVR